MNIEEIDIVELLRTRYKVKCNRCLHFNSDMTVVHSVMDRAADDIEHLRRWKAEASQVMSGWGDLIELVPIEFSRGRIGEPWPTIMADYIRSLKEHARE